MYFIQHLLLNFNLIIIIIIITTTIIIIIIITMQKACLSGTLNIAHTLKPHLHALKNRHGTPNFWHRADDFKARHSQFSTCKRVGPKCNVAPVPKILGVPRLPPGGSLGTAKRGTVP